VCDVTQFVDLMDEFKKLGVDSVICVAINDEFVMEAWGKGYHAQDKGVLMLGDGDGSFTRSLGLDQELEGMGRRGRRFSMLVDDGVIRMLNVEEPGPMSYKVSGPETLLRFLQAPSTPQQ
jgi:peroxiredoxin